MNTCIHIKFAGGSLGETTQCFSTLPFLENFSCVLAYLTQIHDAKRLNSLLIFSSRFCAGDRRILRLRIISEDSTSLKARSALQVVGNDADESK